MALIVKTKMDVLHPQLLWLGGRCYRKYPTDDVLADRDKLEEEVDYSIPVECQEEPCDVDFDIEKLPNGQFKTFMKISKAYYGSVVGPSGAVRKRIEMETKSRINVPRYGENGDIIIAGPTKAAIVSARTRIELIVDAARQRQAFTHFLSVPTSVLKSNFLDFRDDVLRQCDGSRGLDGSIFQKPEKLHLTIGTMPLTDKRERDTAIKLLAECKDVIHSMLNKEPLLFDIEGLEYMNDDPAEVDVLYAKIKPSETGNRLQLIADYLVDRFVHEGIMQKQNERVKLHMTVVNTIFRKDNSGELGIDSRNPRGNQRESFDATKILKLFENYNFGKVRVPHLHISQRYSTAKNEYYTPLATLALP